ncbi:hypothetical protein cand_036210 [Cryptosporidium andersoni]|uniref:Protein kinase domain-containing protein n=1 Tax=Cryptosporidium andersoni TaxID=117008 RepID=A0A1J4MUZ9_9CRYT|nr:hypothetical protein cand_036210 [Cryptosporidium andersoni]
MGLLPHLTKAYPIITVLLWFITNSKRSYIYARDASDKIIKKFFQKVDRPLWERTLAPRDEIAIVCHLLSGNIANCLKFEDREIDGANPGHENYYGYFIQYGTYGAVALAESEGPLPVVPYISANINSAKMYGASSEKINEVMKLFDIPESANNVRIAAKCTFDTNSKRIIPINNSDSNLISDFDEELPLKLAIKASFHYTYTRELYYTTLLSQQIFPMLPAKTYGYGKIRITPRIYCFTSSKDPVMTRLLISEKIDGVTIQVLIRWLTSPVYLNWISLARNSKELQKRLDNRAEVIWIFIHSLLSTLTSFYMHSEFGYIVHCDLNSGNIQVANTSFDPNSWDYENNINALLSITPENIKILDFGETRSTLEESIQDLKCNHPSDMWRIKFILTRLLIIDKRTHPNLIGWTVEFPNTKSSQPLTGKRNRILNHMDILKQFHDTVIEDPEFVKSRDLYSTFETLADGLDSLCDILVRHIAKFKEISTFITHDKREYISCSPLEAGNARETPIRMYRADLKNKLKSPIFPEKSATLKRKRNENKGRASANSEVNKNTENNHKLYITQQIPQGNKNLKDRETIISNEKPINQGGVSLDGIHGMGVGSTSESNMKTVPIQLVEPSNIKLVGKYNKNIVATSIGLLQDDNIDAGKITREIPIFAGDPNVEMHKIEQIDSLPLICEFVNNSKSKDARKWLYRLKMRNSALQGMIGDIELASKEVAERLLVTIEVITKKPIISTSDQRQLKALENSRSKLLYNIKSCPNIIQNLTKESNRASEDVNKGIEAFENERHRILKRCTELSKFVPKNEEETIRAAQKTREIIGRGKKLLHYRFHLQEAMNSAYELMYSEARKVQRLIELCQEGMKGENGFKERFNILIDRISEYKV